MKCKDCFYSKYYIAKCKPCGGIPLVKCTIVNVWNDANYEHNCDLLNKE